MVQIRLENVTFGYTQNLFENVTLTFDSQDRTSIVGNNGSGKSTLLKCIAGLIEPHQGRVIKPKGIKAGFIEQDIPEALRDTVLHDVIAAAIPEDERDYNTWKVDVALDSFKAPEALRRQPIKHLSGGWQRLALIARTWVGDPDILFLDEPTNHLDVSKIFALEQWLTEQVGTIPMVVISHDRRFLDKCTNRTVFLRGLQVSGYTHPYTVAKKLLAEDDKTAALKRERETREVERLKQSAHELRQIGVNHRSDLALRKSAQITRRAEQVESNLTEVHVEARRDIRLGSSEIAAKRLIGFKDVTVRTPDGVALFKIDRLDVMQGDRLVLFGENGAGKSQLLRMIREATLNVDEGRTRGIAITPRLKMGYIDQHLSQLPAGTGLRTFFMHEFALGDQKATALLVNAGFARDLQHTAFGTLSHGQRSRAALLALRLLEPNFYLMDEPTNHLDIAGVEQLGSEILKHEAACFLVSHDRAFCDDLGSKFYAIRKKTLVQVESPEAFYRTMLTQETRP